MMTTSKTTHATLFSIVIFSITSFKLAYCLANTTIFCREIEKRSLLSFKQSLQDPENLLSSWDGEVNCCKWEGVFCNNFTGHVYQLRLRQRNHLFQGLSGKLDPSLLNLKQLKYLDLSQNNFVGEAIPSFIGSFTNLEYLNLSDAGFQGKIPQNIGNLSSLRSLALANLSLDVDSLEWLKGLPRLRYLNMNGVNLRKESNWAQMINSLPSLLELHFAFCSLSSSPPMSDVNVSSLTFLDLSHNKFQASAIPRWIFQLKNLLYLDLSYNNLRGTIPSVSNATKLQYIDLSRNDLNSTIPDWLYSCKDLEVVHLSDNLLHGGISNSIENLTNLKTLDFFGNHLEGKIPREISNLCKLQYLLLTYNKFQGELSDSFGKMSECFLRSIILLCVRSNHLSGAVIDQFGEFKRIRYLHLGDNSFTGAIPSSLGKLSSLEELSLYGNKFAENIPVSFGQLFNLVYLYIDDNKLEGTVNENFFVNLTKLKTFSASGNHFMTLNVSPDWVPPFQLRALTIGSWSLGVGSGFPSWLETQKNISELDLSNTGISGSVPSWLWKIKFLNVSHNRLHGEIPYIRAPRYAYLSSNRFSGSLPRIGGTVQELDLSNNSFYGGIYHSLCDMAYESYELKILHLGGNELSGELPDCWMKWPSLRYVNLGDNNMFGSIPNSIGYLTNLMSLNLYRNKLSGQLPFSMSNCTKLVKIELADNELDGSVPAWMGTSLVKLRILVLRSNKLSDEISPRICHLNSLQILDLSGNNFSGTIPRCVYNFTAMAIERSLAKYDYSSSSNSRAAYFIDSASVATKGSQLQYDTILSLVTNIDLSGNNLSGDIPKELASLVELGSLNLSRNHLTGSIPDNIGDMKRLESLDLSRNSLSGHIPNSLSLTSSLSHLDLSFNHLTGRIPESTQILGFDSSNFIGNDLCGPPLTSNCSGDGDDQSKADSEGDIYEIEWFYVFLSLGYAVGLSVVCTTLVLKKSWREAYFESTECMWRKLCVVYIRFRKPISPSL